MDVQRLGGRWGCHKFVPVLGGGGPKIAPAGDLFDQPPRGRNRRIPALPQLLKHGFRLIFGESYTQGGFLLDIAHRVFATENSVAEFRRDISMEKATKFVPILMLRKIRRNSPTHP